MLVQGFIKNDANGNPAEDSETTKDLAKTGWANLHVNDLPDEILARIFGYLHPVLDQLPLLAMVCCKWRRILRSTSSLWRELDVDPRNYKYWHFSLLCCIFRVYGLHVQRLTWYEHAPVYESVFSLVPRLSSLRYLQLPILWTRAVVESLYPLGRLEQVQINGGFSLDDEDLERVGTYFSELRIVSLNACWKVTASGVSRFLDSLKHLEDLKLKINSGLPLSDIQSEDAMREGGRIAQMVSESPWAGLVSVLCLHFVPMEMDELWVVVKKMTGLKKLSISNCEVRAVRYGGWTLSRPNNRQLGIK